MMHARWRWASALLAAIMISSLESCDRIATLNLYFDPQSCGREVPAGGSLLFEYDVDGVPGLCPSCIEAVEPLRDSEAIAAAIGRGASSCADIHPGASVRVSVVARPFSCTVNRPPPTSVFCSKSAPLKLGDGTSDATVLATLTCADCSTQPVCTPIAICSTDICGVISDGCGGTLDCGDPCKPPLKCRGGHCAK